MARELRLGHEEPSFLEAPWLRRQVETHLVFGFFARRLDLSWILLSFIVLGVVSALGESWLILLGRTASAALFLLVWWPIFRMPRYRQAAVGWCAVKAALALMSFITLLVGGLVGFFRGQSDATHLTVLALIWFPSIEFLPSLVNHQRFITLGRMLLSLPLVVLGSRAGGWTWY